MWRRSSLSARSRTGPRRMLRRSRVPCVPARARGAAHRTPWGELAPRSSASAGTGTRAPPEWVADEIASVASARTCARRRQRRERSLHLRRMPLWFHLLEDLRDLPRRIDDERRAFDAHVFAPIHRLLLPHAILLRHRMISVRQQREGQLVLRLELLMALHLIGRHPKDHGFRFVEPRERVAKLAGFRGAAAGVVLGIEVEDDRFPLEIPQRETLTGVGVERERRGWFSDDGHGRQG